MVKYCFSILIFCVESTLLSWSLYQAAVSVAGFFKLKRPSVNVNKYPRILCLTAAHNEEKVIAEHVRSLKAIDYPDARYDVVVLADNCTDATPRIAKSLGAIVWERHNAFERGKGYALRWALHSKARLSRYDAVCIFDADNLVNADFLKVMAKHLARGDAAIQGYLDTKNPYDNWISLAYASMYWFMNRFSQRARDILGLTAVLGGTGFCLSTAVLRRHPFEAVNLTEDLEYTARLTIAGHRVVFAKDARVYDEKPLGLEASAVQRLRWMQGHWTTALKYLGPLLRKALFSRHGKMRALDMSIYVLQPVFVALMGVNLVLSILQYIFGASWYFPWLTHLIPSVFWDVMSVVGFGFPLTAFVLERAGWRAFVFYPLYLFFTLTWIPLSIEAVHRRHSREWVHTEHHRSISLDEMRQSN
ncbi:hypothetical protein AN477_16460 [Alicyclobacillus ferrooxydans]|uniref:Glycosyl transferase family 2 n=1 Tax=Alicyclobacillus ferrooxydans TaxID=471514 RepID=A0A0P9GPP4_9BACL|nr:hypothetical protein AN477_16460 [Alicyclobacillus ferrooxydans]